MRTKQERIGVIVAVCQTISEHLFATFRQCRESCCARLPIEVTYRALSEVVLKMVKHSKTKTEIVAVPADVLGTRAAVFFLLRKSGRQRSQNGFTKDPANMPSRPAKQKDEGKRGTKTILQTDEFIFT